MVELAVDDTSLNGYSHPPSDQFSALRSALMNSLQRVVDLPLDTAPAFVRHAQLALEIFQGIEAAETGDVEEEEPDDDDKNAVIELRTLTLQEISERVAAALKVPHASLTGPRRTLHVAFARQVAMYVCRKLTKRSFPAIGEHFGRDHSTVIHAFNLIERRVESDIPFRRTIERIERELTVYSAPVATAPAA